MKNRATRFLALMTGILGILLTPGPGICASSPIPAVTGQTGATPAEDYLLINFYLRQQDYTNAVSAIDKFLEKHPNDPFILTEKALLLKGGSDDSAGALQLLKKARAAYPAYYYANYLEAAILFSRYGDNKEKVDQAVSLLKMAIKDDPGFFESYFLMGAILSDREQYEESNKYLEKALSIKRSVKAYLYLAANFQQLKDTKGEVRVYKKLLEFSPYNYSALSTLSRYYLEKKEFKTALRFLEKLFIRTPDNPQVSSEYLYALFAAGEIKKFKEVSDRVDIKNNPMLLYAKALVLSRERKFNEAEKLLNTMQNGDIESYLLLSEIYLRKQDYYNALQTLDKISPSQYNFHYFLARLQALSMLNLNTRTVELYERIISAPGPIPPLTPGSYYTVMFAQADLNRLDKIKETAATAVKKFTKTKPAPEDIETLKPFQDLQTLLNRFTPEEAFAVAEPGEKIEFDRNMYLILSVYKKNKRFDHAEKLINRLLENDDTFKTPKKNLKKDEDTGSPDLYLELSEIYQEQKRFEEAEKLLKRLISRFPDSMRVKNFYAYFLVERNRDLEKALKLSAQTLAKDNDNPAYLDTYGFILFRLGRVAEAEKYLETAHNKLPFEWEIMEHLAACYRSKNKHQQIILMYQKAIDIGVDYKDKLQQRLKVLKQDTGRK